MYFDRDSRRNPSSPRKSNDSVASNFELSPTSNISIPKNNVGAPQNDNQPQHDNLIGFNPDDGTYSPIPQHYSQSNPYLEEQFCGFAPVPLEDNMFENYSIKTQDNNPPTQNVSKQNYNMFNKSNSTFNFKIPANRKSNNSVTLNFRLPTPPNLSIPKNNAGTYQNDNQPRPSNLIKFNPNNGTSSPISQLYPQLNSNWEPLPLDFDMYPINDNMPEKVSISTQNPPTQNAAQQDDDMFSQLTSIFNYETPANKSNGPHQKNILASNTAPQNTKDQYLYDNLAQALDSWVKQLDVGGLSKSTYKTKALTFVRLMDLYGIYNPGQKQIEDFANNYFKSDNRRNIYNFKSATQRFFEWIVNNHIYNKIKSVSTHSMNDKKLAPSINGILVKFLNRWSTISIHDDYKQFSYKNYIFKLITFLTEIQSLSPTVEDMKTYFQNNLRSLAPSIINEHRIAIKGFLKFIESLGVPQNHNVYDYLNSNQ